MKLQYDYEIIFAEYGRLSVNRVPRDPNESLETAQKRLAQNRANLLAHKAVEEEGAVVEFPED